MLQELFVTFATYTVIPLFMHTLEMAADPVLCGQTILWLLGVWGVCKYIGHIQHRDSMARLRKALTELTVKVETDDGVYEQVVYVSTAHLSNPNWLYQHHAITCAVYRQMPEHADAVWAAYTQDGRHFTGSEV